MPIEFDQCPSRNVRVGTPFDNKRCQYVICARHCTEREQKARCFLFMAHHLKVKSKRNNIPLRIKLRGIPRSSFKSGVGHLRNKSAIRLNVKRETRNVKRQILTIQDSRFMLRASEWPKHVRAYGGWLGRTEPTKDVAACDKPRGGGKQPLIRGCLNGETPPHELRGPTSEYIGCAEGTWGSETSQYPEEKKKIKASL